MADLEGQPGSGALAATSLTYEWSASPYLNLSHANITGGGGAFRRSLFLLPHALQLSAGSYRLTLTARLATGSSAYASVSLLVNSPPYGGTLRLAFAGSEARALYPPYISPISPVYLPYISRISPLYLAYISRRLRNPYPYPYP